ncbi:MAG: FecR domain-containing protein [Caulobacter sp.]|nr:FecR domain-containing protein [Caulobacter sp.]
MTSSRLDEIRAEAAGWLARLRNEGRSHESESAFLAWLRESDDHRASFDAVTATFELAGALKEDRKQQWRPVQMDRRAVLAGLGVAAVGVGWLAMAPTVYATGIGETRTINLDDGSSILLDADSRIRVELDRRQRRMTLVRGRAYFKAAGDPARPFVVVAGDREIVGEGGDAFDVRLGGEAVSVVTVLGNVLVVQAGQPSNRIQAGVGQRLTLTPGAAAHREATDAQAATAWRFGQAVFENQTLAQALDEMNRYSRRRIRVSDPTLENLRISGVYKTGDNEAFARSVATLLGLGVRDAGGTLIIERDHAS